MKEAIEQALQPLIGMPLWKAHRAADLQVFQFGARHQAMTFQGHPTLVGDCALHIQCGWRIVGPGGIVTGRRDLYYPAGGDPYRDLHSFDYDGPVPNRRDARLAALLEERSGTPLVVMSCSADPFGSFRLAFSDGFALEVFPDDSVGGEYWRLLHPHTDGPHFVVSGKGIERD